MENKFGMDIPTEPGESVCAPWGMKVTAVTDCIKWESEIMSGEFLYITSDLDAVVAKGAAIGTATGARVRLQISGIDPRLIFKLIGMLRRV